MFWKKEQNTSTELLKEIKKELKNCFKECVSRKELSKLIKEIKKEEVKKQCILCPKTRESINNLSQQLGYMRDELRNIKYYFEQNKFEELKKCTVNLSHLIRKTYGL